MQPNTLLISQNFIICKKWVLQYLLSVYRLHGIILASIISLTDLSIALCLFMVFTGSCMTRFDLLSNYHLDLESLIRKSHSRLSGSHVQEIVDKF
jgi:hypothetical protein